MIGCAALGRVSRTVPGLLHAYAGEFASNTTPALHRDYADEAVAGLCEWLALPEQTCSTACWSRLGLETAGWQRLSRYLDERGQRFWVRGQFDRPGLRRRSDFAAYLDSLPRKRRAAWEVDRRRLDAAGEVTVRLHRNLHDYDLLRRFLALEALGAGADAAKRDTDVFTAITENLAERNELFFVEVVVDGEPISISANFVDGHTAYSFKVAYDTAFRDLAPGANNVIELTRLLHEDPLLRAAVSCVEENSPAARLWCDPVPVGNVLMATRGVKSVA